MDSVLSFIFSRCFLFASLAMIVFGQLTISICFIVRILIRKQCEFWTLVMNEQKRYVLMEGGSNVSICFCLFNKILNLILHYSWLWKLYFVFQILEKNRRLMDAVVNELVEKKSLTKQEFFRLVDLHGSLEPMPPSILDIRIAKCREFQKLIDSGKEASLSSHA